MRSVALYLICTLIATAGPRASKVSKGQHNGHETVQAHTRKGKQVDAYDRTRKNGNCADNWSTKGNVNPDTGKMGTKKCK